MYWPDGMAKTLNKKLQLLNYCINLKKIWLRPEQFIFDVLTFTLATGEEEFLDAQHTLKELNLSKKISNIIYHSWFK